PPGGCENGRNVESGRCGNESRAGAWLRCSNGAPTFLTWEQLNCSRTLAVRAVQIILGLFSASSSLPAFASGFRSGIALPWPHAALVSTITPIFTKRENLICHLFQEPQPAQGYLQSSARSGFCLLTEALAASMLKSSAKRIGVFAPYACIARNSNSSDRTTSLLLPQIEHLPFVAGDTNSQSTQ